MVNKKQMYDVIVIGAGAAGMMCAATAAERGKKVLMIEQSKKPGRKILMSGGGRCNFTNLYTTHENFLCSNPHFVKSALSQFNQWDFQALVIEAGINWHEREHGQLFCDDTAADIVKLLLDRCDKSGVELLKNCTLENVSGQQPFVLDTNQGQLNAKSVVIATGGLTVPSMDSTDIGHRIFRQYGHKVIPLRPALVPFILQEVSNGPLKILAGISLPVAISCNKKSFSEALLFTHKGISGPSVLQISNYWNKGDSISIDLLPDENAADWLMNARETHPNRMISTQLAKQFPKRLVEALMPLWKISDGPLGQMKKQLQQQLIDCLQSWELTPTGTEGYRTAEVTIGGVDTDGFSSKTMQSKKAPGLYVVGEVLDVTGHLGGFNFQWAWSSGYAAGMAIK
ncbi:NAD(P)/FAD-dependent oxidoreductase [Pelagibaculum spongiae]|uniref:Aminoacetone oxidase family FAD-binding enzyme n=1 Tax=Pelagibaculum spongiae TaxID=2080658 RepID=A0A2V1GXU8_9GAMM|nr:NAD(P)/FAD-dependent oxidoreductase [Pelagibaculum spongiae]PVZ70463.1 aminoacetone oxidase family FAD-binding enzyme [Pelagibaculum spongiae]